MLLTGNNIAKARVLTLRKGLELEMKGMKLSHGRSCYSIIKAEFGYKGSKAAVLEQINQFIEANILPKGE